MFWIYIVVDDVFNSFFVGLSVDGFMLYLLDSSGCDKVVLVSCRLDDFQVEKMLIVQYFGVDIGGVWSDFCIWELLGWMVDVEWCELYVFNVCIQDDVVYLNVQGFGEW